MVDSFGVRDPQPFFLHDSVVVRIPPGLTLRKRSVPQAVRSSELRFRIVPEGASQQQPPLHIASTIGALFQNQLGRVV